jgi:LPS export ABC transporter protein LptC/lipopolysaccharide transport protein LptA
MLGLMVQIVLIAPSQIRDAENKAAILPSPSDTSADSSGDLGVPGARNGKPVQSIQGMRMIETQEGRKEWELQSDKATRDLSKSLLNLENVKAVFFSDSGVTFTVTGDKGLVKEKSKNLHIEGNVVTRSSNGYVFKTESMDYDSENRFLTGSSHVDMVGPKDANGLAMHLTGEGIRASLTKSTMEVLRDVKSEKPLEKNRQAYIRSHRALFTGRDKTANFYGNVVLDMDSMRITGPEAHFSYDSKTDMVRTAVFKGGARVSDSQKWATAENVSMDLTSNRFVFKGNPRVVQNNDELRGQEIIFIDGGKKVQVKGARAQMDERSTNQIQENK